VNSQQVKEVIANEREKLNRLMIIQTSHLLTAKFYQNWYMIVKDIASQHSEVFQTQYD